MTLTKSKIDELRKIAGKFSPGKWKTREGSLNDHWELWNDDTHEWYVQDDSGVEPPKELLEYLESFNPTQVIELLDSLEKVQAALGETIQQLEFMYDAQRARPAAFIKQLRSVFGESP